MRTKTTSKKLLALLLTLVMVIGILPMTAFAADGDLHVGGVLMESGMYLPSSPDGSVKALQSTAPSTGGYAYLSADGATLTLHDYQFKTTSGETNSVYSEQASGLNILLEGNTNLENKDNCIEAEYGNVTIRGNAADGADTLTMTSGLARYTVYAAETTYGVGNISIENCKVKGNGGDDCMFAERGYNINNCELDLLGDDNALCAVAGGIVIKNSTGKLYGQTAGAHSNLGNITIENSNLDIRSNGSYPGSIALDATYGSVTIKDSSVVVQSSATQAIRLNSGLVPILTYTNGVKVNAGDDSDSAVPVVQADLSGNWYTNKYVKIEPKTATSTTDPTPVESPIALLKEIKGKNIPSAFSFTFKLKASDGSVFDTLTVTADEFRDGSGIFSFSKPVSFTEAGTYDFTVTEDDGGESGWTYDSSVMTLRFTVIEGNEGLEISDISGYEGGVEADLIFTNTYDSSGSGGGETPVDVNYKVEHWLQQADGTYALEETENLTGTEGQIVTAASKTYEGYTLDEDNDEAVTSLELTAIATTVPTLKLYYNLNGDEGTDSWTITIPVNKIVDKKANADNPPSTEVFFGLQSPYGDSISPDTYSIETLTTKAGVGENKEDIVITVKDEVTMSILTDGFLFFEKPLDSKWKSSNAMYFIGFNDNDSVIVFEAEKAPVVEDTNEERWTYGNTVFDIAEFTNTYIKTSGGGGYDDDDNEYIIRASAGTGGSINPSGNVYVDEGSSKSFTMTPASGYVIDKVLVDGEDKGAITSYTFSNVRKDHTISVTFKAAPATPGDDEPDEQNPDTGAPGQPENPERPIDPNVPQTGDNSHTTLWIALVGISLLGMIATLFGKKRSYFRHSR